ncbi:MAG TPA: hypothetical protein VGF79_13925 [Bacteroidia bacterium]
MKTQKLVLLIIVFVQVSGAFAQQRLVLQFIEDSSIQKEIFINDYIKVYIENGNYNNKVLGYSDSSLFMLATKVVSDTQYFKKRGKYKREINTNYLKDTLEIKFNDIRAVSRRRIKNIDFLSYFDYFGLTALFNVLYLPADLLLKQQTFKQWLITESIVAGIFIVPNYAFTRKRKFETSKWRLVIVNG